MRRDSLSKISTSLERHKFFNSTKTDVVTYLGSLLSREVYSSDVDCKKKVKEI